RERLRVFLECGDPAVALLVVLARLLEKGLQLCKPSSDVEPCFPGLHIREAALDVASRVAAPSFGAPQATDHWFVIDDKGGAGHLPSPLVQLFPSFVGDS